MNENKRGRDEAEAEDEHAWVDNVQSEEPKWTCGRCFRQFVRTTVHQQCGECQRRRCRRCEAKNEPWPCRPGVETPAERAKRVMSRATGQVPPPNIA